jgi:hypothetical protein
MAFNNVGMAVRFSYAMKVDDQDAKYSQDRCWKRLACQIRRITYLCETRFYQAYLLDRPKRGKNAAMGATGRRFLFMCGANAVASCYMTQ